MWTQPLPTVLQVCTLPSTQRVCPSEQIRSPGATQVPSTQPSSHSSSSTQPPPPATQRSLLPSKQRAAKAAQMASRQRLFSASQPAAQARIKRKALPVSGARLEVAVVAAQRAGVADLGAALPNQAAERSCAVVVRGAAAGVGDRRFLGAACERHERHGEKAKSELHRVPLQVVESTALIIGQG